VDYDPLSEVIDAPLSIVPDTLCRLRQFRGSEKFANLPGLDTAEEQARLSAALDSLVDQLIAGVEANPSKLWVLGKFQPVLDSLYGEDTEGKEHLGEHLGEVMDILGIESSDGLLGFYL
jgi:hypothetical protein